MGRTSIPGNLLLAAWTALLAAIVAGPWVFPGGLAGSPAAAAGDARLPADLVASSIAVAFGAAVGALLLALVPAYVAARSRPRPAAMLLSLAAMPALLPPAALSVAAILFIGPAGYLAGLFPAGSSATGEGWLYSLAGVAAVHAVAFAPVALAVLYATFRRVPPELEDAARLDGSPWQVAVHVTLPAARGGIAVAFLSAALLSISDFAVPEGLRSQPVLSVEVYRQVAIYYDARAAAAPAGWMLAVGLLLAAMASFLRGAGDLPPAAEYNSSARVGRLPRVAAWCLAAIPSIAIVATLLGAAGELVSPPLALAEVAWLCREELAFTAWTSVVAGAAALAVGVGLAVVLARSRSILPRLFVLAGALLPGGVVGGSIKSWLLWPPGSLPLGLDGALASLDGTIVPMTLAAVVRTAPLVALLVEAGIRATAIEYEWIASLEGAGGWRGWFGWRAPMMAPYLAGGFLLAVSLQVGEVAATILLVPPGPTTLGVRIMTLLHFAPTWQVAAMAVLLGAIPVAGAIGAALLLRRRD